VTDVASGPTLPGAVDDDFQLPQALRDKPTFTPQSHRDIHKNAWKQCLACKRLKEDIKFAFKTKDIADFEMRIQMDINHLHTLEFETDIESTTDSVCPCSYSKPLSALEFIRHDDDHSTVLGAFTTSDARCSSEKIGTPHWYDERRLTAVRRCAKWYHDRKP
jgi:hypothetical protein